MSEFSDLNPLPENQHLTALHHSLAHEYIGSQDKFIRHPSGGWRAIEYTTPNTDILEVRDRLYRHGLVLGRLVTENDEPKQTYVIPNSSRPLAYEASSGGVGEYTYNDPKLFAELGELIGLGTAVTGHKYVIKGDLGRAVALVGLTRPNERQLLFVPGIEALLSPKDHKQNALNFYTDRINRQFGYRFARASVIFQNGYLRAINNAGE